MRAAKRPSLMQGIRVRIKFIYAITIVALSLVGYNIALSQLGSFNQDGIVEDSSMEYISSVKNAADSVDIYFQMTAVDTIREFAVIEYEITPYGSYGYTSNESSYIKQPFAVQYSASGQSRQPSADLSSWIHLPSDEWIGGFEAPINLYPCSSIGVESPQNSSASYPIDKYCFDILVNTYDEKIDASGVRTILDTAPITWLYHYGNGLDGYQISLKRVPYFEVSGETCDATKPPCTIQEDAEYGYSRVIGMVERTSVVQIFTWVVIGMIILAAICAITLTLAVISGARPPALEGLAFLAALLFAVQPLRSALPDAPPVGMDLDVRIFYPCILAILVSLAVQVGLWVRRPDYRA